MTTNQSEWLPIEAMPAYEFVLGYCKEAFECNGAASESKGVMIICRTSGNQILDHFGIEMTWPFTHWMPIPEQPNKLTK